MDCIHRFHLRFGVILRCLRCSKHGDSLRGSPFIVSGENSGSDREGETILAWFVRYWKLEANFFASTVKFWKTKWEHLAQTLIQVKEGSLDCSPWHALIHTSMVLAIVLNFKIPRLHSPSIYSTDIASTVFFSTSSRWNSAWKEGTILIRSSKTRRDTRNTHAWAL